MHALRIVVTALLCLPTLAPNALAQLRPLDAADLSAFAGGSVRVQMGGGLYFDQRASLAGTQGRLLELGDVRALFRTGRVLLEFSGTVQRYFEDEVVLQPPFGGAQAPPPDGRRHDSGDYRVSTVVRLTRAASPTLAAVRFGTRLPTTDNRIGLDRDATDFFLTLAARRPFGNVSLSAEAGLSINGTRQSNYEQSDVFVYAMTADLAIGGLTPFVSALGQQDFHDWAVRGNEDLGETRVGVRAGKRRWISAAWVRGFSTASPSHGFQVSAGVIIGGR